MNKSKFKESLEEYEKIHQEKGFIEEIEYYQAIAAILRGNKSVDIGCGEGFVEKFSPETVAVDFSIEALHRAKLNGANYLVRAAAEYLPFKDNTFEVALSSGVLEHFINQKQAIEEMSHISKMQVHIVHAKLPFPLEYFKKLVFRILQMKAQPVEKPLSMNELKAMLDSAGLKVIFQGFWNYIDLRYVWRKIPYGLIKIPSHHFVFTVKTQNTKRKFIG